MPNSNQRTLVSLFHTPEDASKALSDLQNAGIPQQSIQSIGATSASAAPEQSLTALKALNLPARDLRILSDGLKSGGIVIIVRANKSLAAETQNLFEHENAEQIDERGPANSAAVESQKTELAGYEKLLEVERANSHQGAHLAQTGTADNARGTEGLTEVRSGTNETSPAERIREANRKGRANEKAEQRTQAKSSRKKVSAGKKAVGVRSASVKKVPSKRGAA